MLGEILFFLEIVLVFRAFLFTAKTSSDWIVSLLRKSDIAPAVGLSGPLPV